LFPSPPSRTGSRPGRKKAEGRIDADYLDWALDGFSGYIAADELYDGPYCVLSIVDNRSFKRISYRVPDHDPTHADIREFFSAFRAALEKRGLVLEGITADGSPLYPQPIAEIFPDVRHQLCEFHVLAEITKAVLHAVAKVRKTLANKKAKLSRGRPSSKQARRAARRNRRLQQKIGDLFDHRHLFVAHRLTLGDRRILQRITRDLPHLRTLREIMDEVYRLFDRRCRTDTALAKLAKLRMRVRRFKKVGKTLGKLFSPNLEKALTFLDDKLLPATSNAVERGNRRHRKMQKSVYRVRTQSHIAARIAIDMLRDAQAAGRCETTQTLHYARDG
jgi:Transposase